MKRILIWAIIAIFSCSMMTSCLKEDTVSAPKVDGIKFYMTDKSGKDSLVTTLTKGKAIKIMVLTSADICSVWPGGVRQIMKKKISLDGGQTYADSLDMFNHPVLVASDAYVDYGLVGAKGLKTTQTTGGWYASYTYKTSGSFDLTVVVTNHGYNGPDYNQKVYPMGKFTIN